MKIRSGKTNFSRVVSVLCAVALLVSTLGILPVGTVAATISRDENVFTAITQKTTETYEFQANGTQVGGAVSEGNGNGIPGIASSLNGLDGTTNRIYQRTSNRGTNTTLAMKWASVATQKSGVMLGKTGANVGSGTDQAYVLEDNTTYEISYDYYNHNGTALTLNILGVNAAQNEVLQDAEDNYTYTVLDSTTIDATAASKAWTTYNCTFKTGTLGSDKYLSFAVFREQTTALEFWLDNVKVTKVTTLDTAELITFKDNGKTYYAYPDDLTALPDGDNGSLGSAFAGWYDAEGNKVTEVPAAGTVLTAKYPLFSVLPESYESLNLSLTNTTEANNLANRDAKGVLGMVSSSNSSHGIHSRSKTLADGATGNVVKFANANTAARSIAFGKANVAANGAGNAYVLSPNTTYTVSYYLFHEAGSGVSFDLLAAAAINSTTGYTLDSNTPEAVVSSWVKYTRTFTTPDAASLGTNQYLIFAVTNPGQVNNTVWLYDVTITKTIPGSPADYISFKDGGTVCYAEPGTLTSLPEVQPRDEDFLGWYDAEGNRVTAVPTEAGTVLTARYGTIETGIIATSVRHESGKGDTYVSAGIRFRGRIENTIANNASEIGFILVPNGNDVESDLAVKGVNKSTAQGIDIIYEHTYEGYTDYQVILTNLTREGVEKNLCSLLIDVYFYYVVDGVTYYCGDSYTDSYDQVVARMEADPPVVNNLLTAITSAETGEAAADKLSNAALTLTPPAYTTALGTASYLDATDDTTLMTVTDTSKTEYEEYLTSLETLGYTAVVGNSRILSSENYSAIYSDGTNLINVNFIAAESTVKVTIEPLGYSTVDEVNEYLKIFHTASAEAPEAYVCDPLFLTIGLSGSEDNSDDDFYHGLGYMYRLADGSFVIIDGGHNGDTYDHAGKIYSMLKYYAPDPENIVISAWIMTHAHSDHMYVFQSFAPEYIADASYNVTLESIIANLPHENWIGSSGLPETGMAPFRTLFAECETRGTAVYKAHVGQVYNLPGFTTEMLFTLEQTAPKVENKSMSNSSSLVFRTVIEGKSFIFTADATSTSITYVNNVFGEALKSDFIQTPHHGTCSNFSGDAALADLSAFYTDYVKAEYVLWSSAEAGMNYYLTTDNPNADYSNSIAYENNIALGHNVKELKLNADTIEFKTLEYYELDYLKKQPVAITTEAEFKAIADDSAGYYYLANDITVTETVTAPYWGASFEGYLDGRGNTVTFTNAIDTACGASQTGVLCTTVKGVIRNISFGSAQSPMQLNYSDTASGAIGLFGSTRANVAFDSVTVYANIAHTVSGSYSNYVGGFLGRIYRSSANTAGIVTFKDCKFIGTYTESANTGGNLKAFGGLVGAMTEQAKLQVTNCTIDATIDAKCSTAASGVGGVVGRVTKVYDIAVSDTTVKGAITGRSFVGGMIGSVDATTGKVVISGCTNNATLSGSTTDDMCANPGSVTTIVSSVD